jgi:hypothetical protein
VVYHSEFPLAKTVPRFSFVIPATRPHLLKYSVGSALRQSISDFEIVISDNSAQGLRDHVPFSGDPRIRYVRTERVLPHYRSWEFGFANARGDWLILLGDDDVVIPQSLAVLADASDAHPGVEILSWTHGGYVDANFPSAAQRGIASLPPMSCKIEMRSNPDTLRDLFRLGGEPDGFSEVKRVFPSPLRSAFKRTLVERARQTSSVFFVPSTPDWGAGTVALALTENRLFIDVPLTILNSTADSNAAGGAGSLGSVNQAYAALDNVPFSRVPFKGKSVNRNIIADTILEAKERFPAQLGKYEFDWTAYFQNLYFAMRQVRSQAGEFPELLKDERELDECLASQPYELQQRVRASTNSTAPLRRPARRLTAIASLRAAVSRGWIALLLRLYPLSADAVLRRLARSGIAVRASSAGIRNILEFSRFAGDLIEAASMRQRTEDRRGIQRSSA